MRVLVPSTVPPSVRLPSVRPPYLMADGLRGPRRGLRPSAPRLLLFQPPSLPSLSPTSTGCGSAAIHLASSIDTVYRQLVDMVCIKVFLSSHRRSVQAARPLHRPVHAVSTHTRSPAELHSPLPSLPPLSLFAAAAPFYFNCSGGAVSRSVRRHMRGWLAGWSERARASLAAVLHPRLMQ